MSDAMGHRTRPLEALARMVWQRYPVRGLMLFRRNDAFPRTV